MTLNQITAEDDEHNNPPQSISSRLGGKFKLPDDSEDESNMFEFNNNQNLALNNGAAVPNVRD